MPIGFNISVYRQIDGGDCPAAKDAPGGSRLAVWQCWPVGLKWIEELVAQGYAISVGDKSCHLQFTAQARHISPRLQGEPPNSRPLWGFDDGDVLLPNWLGKTTNDQAVMDACRPDEWLIIDVWDES